MKRLPCLLVLAACGGGDADVAGDYTLALTNRDNGCNFQNWTVGNQATGVEVTVTADSEGVVQADVVDAGARFLLDFALGGHVYTGSVDGDALALELIGRGMTMGNCAFSYNSTIDATLDGDVLTGRIDYRSATNGNPDCGAIEGCVSFQDFNGTRAPQ